MKHLKEGSIAYHVASDRSITEVRVVLQHPTLGTFYDPGRRVLQAWHGELHETREEAEQYILWTAAVRGGHGRSTPVGDSGTIVSVR